MQVLDLSQSGCDYDLCLLFNYPITDLKYRVYALMKQVLIKLASRCLFWKKKCITKNTRGFFVFLLCYVFCTFFLFFCFCFVFVFLLLLLFCFGFFLIHLYMHIFKYEDVTKKLRCTEMLYDIKFILRFIVNSKISQIWWLWDWKTNQLHCGIHFVHFVIPQCIKFICDIFKFTNSWSWTILISISVVR